MKSSAPLGLVLPGTVNPVANHSAGELCFEQNFMSASYPFGKPFRQQTYGQTVLLANYVVGKPVVKRKSANRLSVKFPCTEHHVGNGDKFISHCLR